VHTPIETINDCEGAGKMLQVTTLFSQPDKDYKTKLVFQYFIVCYFHSELKIIIVLG
jgi:hypothetical protein